VNIADDQRKLGRFREADANLRKGIELSYEISDEWREAISHAELGRLEAYQGHERESSMELDTALDWFSNEGEHAGITWAYRALGALLTSKVDEAVRAARQARQFADVGRSELDIIRAEWLLGWALTERSLAEAEAHLSEALTRCRRINLIEAEPDILLAWARWHRAAGCPAEARSHVDEALEIADRCEYRLVQADAHNLLARLALDAGNPALARRQAEIARERA
jgi:tetratricopeptide (TPR) repeat protein